MSIEFTVFTPTYNRGYVLKNSYKALCNQTCKKFIWLIVDDGSTDNTKKIVDEWIKEKKINIQYIYQKNLGKQRAVNTGILNCKTKYFGFLDSDDYYCEKTIEKFLQVFLENKDNDKIAGILARRGKNKEEVIGSKNLPQGKYIENYDNLVKKYNFYGDTCRAYKTNILKEYLYPNIKDKFILEDVMLSPINQKYNLIIVNEIFSISEYLEDGYTKNIFNTYKNNPYGYALGLSELTIARRGIFRQIKYTILFTTWCWIHGIDNAYHIVKNKKLYILCNFLSMICYFFHRPKFFYKD